MGYISSPMRSRGLLVLDFHNARIPVERRMIPAIDHYRSLGILFKRCTMLLPTKERLKYIQKFLSEIPCFKLGGCVNPLQCLGFACCGAFLQSLTAGWDELECHRVYNFISTLTNLPQKVLLLMLEQCVRRFFRKVLLDNWINCKDVTFWLTQILKPWPLVFQARLLYIIFGPVSTRDGHVLWGKMTQGIADEKSLKGIADAVKLLYETNAKAWTPDDVISLLDEISVIPNKWLLENSARLLILSGNSICFTFMASKAVNGRSMDLARIVVFLALVCEKDSYCMDWAVKMMQRVSTVFATPTERRNFLQNVEIAFARINMEMLQLFILGQFFNLLLAIQFCTVKRITHLQDNYTVKMNFL
ncbi:hypothetical protein GDO86_014301 [Hymenochirus boettgeri]|uniref:FBXO47 ARM repeats region domain-containing protein n=1 Tax=Hymenochirus boettgeri TaxID=247094 RepID=A0A8T2JNB9_9PIPI|nr:hypothetical protein GDO86_014301 [Hymenochirus boettgeri]